MWAAVGTALSCALSWPPSSFGTGRRAARAAPIRWTVATRTCHAVRGCQPRSSGHAHRRRPPGFGLRRTRPQGFMLDERSFTAVDPFASLSLCLASPDTSPDAYWQWIVDRRGRSLHGVKINLADFIHDQIGARRIVFFWTSEHRSVGLIAFSACAKVCKSQEPRDHDRMSGDESFSAPNRTFGFGFALVSCVRACVRSSSPAGWLLAVAARCRLRRLFRGGACGFAVASCVLMVRAAGSALGWVLSCGFSGRLGRLASWSGRCP